MFNSAGFLHLYEDVLNLHPNFRSDGPITALLLWWNQLTHKPCGCLLAGTEIDFFLLKPASSPSLPLPDRRLLQPIKARVEVTCRLLLTCTNQSARWENVTFYGQREEPTKRE